MAPRLQATTLSLLVLSLSTLSIAQQIPLSFAHDTSSIRAGGEVGNQRRKLTGKFLHITDIHPDPFYKIGSATDSNGICHSGKGDAGPLGAEKTDCDSPYSLVNATFDWIKKNIRDEVDFVIWTGDSARHDNDENFPRDNDQVLGQNQMLVDKMYETFGKKNKPDGSLDDYLVPIIPTFGNNDMLPHNIFQKGPNRWTRKFAAMWKQFIPEEQIHSFEKGGWFYREVIPNKLAVFNLNTMYFFEKNAAVDGCSDPDEAGYAQLKWLRIQLQLLRERGVKVILSGHVPPARTEDKTLWDETCWQKYSLWMRQFRDIIIGSMYGHMNIEHYSLQDFSDIEFRVAVEAAEKDDVQQSVGMQRSRGDWIGALSHQSYLLSLRNGWSKLPAVPDATEQQGSASEKFFDKIGGRWAERYSASFVSASVVPNYYPTLRIFDYNITDLDQESIPRKPSRGPADVDDDESYVDKVVGFDRVSEPESLEDFDEMVRQVLEAEAAREQGGMDEKKHKQIKEPRKPKPKFTVPLPPSKASLPGPAYSPQTLSWIGYQQLYANITTYNREIEGSRKSKGKKGKTHFEFEVEYDTRDKKDVYKMKDGITMHSLVHLASRIGKYNPQKDDLLKPKDVVGGDGEVAESDEQLEEMDDEFDHGIEEESQKTDLEAEKKKKKKHKHKHKKKRRKIINKSWWWFTSRAVVGTLSDSELHERFGDPED